MAVLIHPQLWNTKPPLGAQLNAGHPLAQGLRAYFLLNEGGGLSACDLVRGSVATLQLGSANDPYWRIGREGPCIQQDGPDSSGLSIPEDAWLHPTAPAITLMGRVEGPSTTTGAPRIFGHQVNGHTSPFHNFMLTLNSATWAINFDATVYNIVAKVTGEIRTLGGTYDGANVRGYRDGIIQATTAKTGNITNSAGQLVIGGDAGQGAGATEGFQAPIYWCGMWARTLLPDEMAWMHKEPFAILLPPQPLRRYFVAPAGGGPITIELSGSLTGAGALGNFASKPIAGSVTGAGVLAKQGHRLMAGNSTAAGVLANTAGKALAGSATATGTLEAIKIALLSLAGSLTPGGALGKLATKPLAGSATVAGALLRQAQKALAGSVAGVGALIKAVSKPLAGAVTGSGALSLTRVLLMSFAGSLAATGALLRQANKGLGGALTPTGALVRALALSLVASIASAGALAKAVAMNVAGSITGSGALDLGAAIERIIHLFGLDRLFFRHSGIDIERHGEAGLDRPTINRKGTDG